ncbi:hypothetical protein [Endozoicomonas euniceicola]|uniref:Uncharacterized protein n=1 Tax=Endozoicomonas euniceicola TaxID=1234143 RepID=A0ABY6GUB8_9GAMM|nr:hypothetical protein [Endozoicomonas euniceicola]UYM16157.1 hypothetical protein NX720_25730 [Endozoicomonas euniceicola]
MAESFQPEACEQWVSDPASGISDSSISDSREAGCYYPPIFDTEAEHAGK